MLDITKQLTKEVEVDLGVDYTRKSDMRVVRLKYQRLPFFAVVVVEY